MEVIVRIFSLVVIVALFGATFAAIAYGLFGSDRMAWLGSGVGAWVAMAGYSSYHNEQEKAKKQPKEGVK